MKILVPEELFELTDKRFIEINDQKGFFTRSKEMEDFYSKCNEMDKKLIYYTFMTQKSTFLEYLIDRIYEISLPYCKEFGFKEDPKKIEKLDEFEREMYVDQETQLEIDRVLYTAFILIPFFDKKKLDVKIGRRFWNHLNNNLLKTNIVKKIEKIIFARYLSTADNRFWGLAEKYGMNKEQWLLQTVNLILTKHIIKIDIGKSFAVYTQVIAKDSLTFATKKNFTMDLNVEDSSRIVNQSPDAFINNILLIDLLHEFVEKNPRINEIEIYKSSFPPVVRYICIITLDWYFGISSDIIFKTSGDTYYQELIRKVTIEILLQHKFLILSDLIKYGNASKALEQVRSFTLYKSDDELLNKSVNDFIRFITVNTSNYNNKGLKVEMKRFFNLILENKE